MADADIPCERLETLRTQTHRSLRQGRFLKGPIPFSWIRNHIQCASDRLLLVLRAHADMQGTLEIKITADILRDAGIAHRKTAYRAIEKLEENGAFTVNRLRGRKPIITFCA
jgi:hypothetical protein